MVRSLRCDRSDAGPNVETGQSACADVPRSTVRAPDLTRKLIAEGVRAGDVVPVSCAGLPNDRRAARVLKAGELLREAPRLMLEDMGARIVVAETQLASRLPLHGAWVVDPSER